MMESRNIELLAGTIILWFGNAADVPAGWQVCDGTNGTPDLRNRYVKGCDADGNLGNVGGALTHSHTLIAGSNVAAGTDLSNTTDAANHEPPWRKIYYIMKLL